MRKLAALLMALVILFGFTSCIQSHELNETAIVQAIGIDLAEGGFRVTLQIYSPKGAGASTAIDTSKNNSSIITTSGETIASAIQSATQMQGKTIFTGHNRIIVLGREFAESGIQSLFSYFNRNALTRQNVQVLMADGTAEEIISTNIEQGILAAQTINQIIDNSSRNGYVYRSPYYLLSKNMNLYNGSAAVPLISFSEGETAGGGEEGGSGGEEGGEKKIPDVTNLEVRRTAVFSEYRFAGELDEEQTRGLLLLSDQLVNSIIVADNETMGKCSVNLYQCETSAEPMADENGEITIKLKVNARASLDEVLSPQNSVMSEQHIKDLSRASEQILADEAQSAFHTAIREYHSDLLYIGDMVLKMDKKLWQELEDQFYEYLPNIKLDTEIKVSIDRIGLETDEKL